MKLRIRLRGCIGIAGPRNSSADANFSKRRAVGPTDSAPLQWCPVEISGSITKGRRRSGSVDPCFEAFQIQVSTQDLISLAYQADHDVSWSYNRFCRFIFPGDTYFNGATFSHNTSFERACFHGNVSFSDTTFACDTWLDGAIFYGRVNFSKVNFIGDAIFYKCHFKKFAKFELATFKQYASFEKSLFSAVADLFSYSRERAFNLRKTVFEDVPDFIQAHFEEPPRLDNMEVRWIPRHPQPDRTRCCACSAINSCRIPHHPRPDERKTIPWWTKGLRKTLHVGGQMRTWPQRLGMCGWKRVASRVRSRMGARDIPSRWRALKRLAIQGHDTERELEFHARELRRQRFAQDWPVPLAFWRGWAW